MARLRDEYADFRSRGTQVLAIGPDGSSEFRAYWRLARLPFIGLADPGHTVAARYRQEVNLLKLGRMPLVMVLDREGRIRYSHHASSMADIPANKVLLGVVDQILAEPGASRRPVLD